MSEILSALQASVIEANKTMTEEEAIKYVMTHSMFTPINMDKEQGQKRKREFALDVINNDLFPHCYTKAEKIYFLGYMANKLIRASLGMIKEDERDSYVNKRKILLVLFSIIYSEIISTNLSKTCRSR